GHGRRRLRARPARDDAAPPGHRPHQADLQVPGARLPAHRRERRGREEDPGMTAARWQRVKDVLDEALNHEAATRVAFLQAACLGDDDLRLEVESLLAA